MKSSHAVRRGFVILVAAALTLALLAAAPAFAVSPIQPDNRPSPVAGFVNGEVPPTDLVRVGPNCLALRAAAPSLNLLFAQARAVGVSLGARECYRSLADQVIARRNATANGNPACAASVGTAPGGGPAGTSMHGWGKAVDLSDAGRTLTFATPGYAFMKTAAAAAGWNHPGWAEPAGSSCPEPWHWEWVGDGGSRGLDPIRADAVALLASPGDAGYASVTGLGAVAVRGNAVDRGSAAAVPIAWVVVGATATASRAGYWMVAGDGGVFSFGDAQFVGSTGGMRLNAPVLGMAPTATGTGYWLFAWDGGVFSFGDARFFGSTGGLPLVRPMVGMAATPSGGGYWLVAADGGVFSFGDAAFHGSGAGTSSSPVVDVLATTSGGGYWLQRADGQVQAFGDAVFYGDG